MIGFGLLFGLFCFATSIVLPWVNHSDIKRLRGQMDALRQDMERLQGRAPQAAPPREAKEPMPSRYVPDTFDEPEPKKPEPVYEAPIPVAAVVEPIAAYAAEKNESGGFEQSFGGKAFVWLGGIALALAGLFLVKYTIEAGLLTEKIRTVLGFLFGFVLIGSSFTIQQFPNIANGKRIAQALAGAGIADLYGSIFAATTLYHFFPSWFGFACLVVVTGGALVMSLRYGAPIAVLGLIGGFVTPMLIHGDPNTPVLFSYLLVLFGAISTLARRQGWWWLSLLATAVSFSWVGLSLVNGFVPADGFWLSMFLIGMCAVTALSTKDVQEDDAFAPSLSLRYLTMGGALLLIGAVTATSHYGAFEWDMFGVMSVGAIILAAIDHKTYGFAPWLAMAANAMMLLSWQSAMPDTLTITISVFCAMFFLSGFAMVWRGKNAVSSAGLSAASGVLYFLIAYHRLNVTDDVWAIIAFAFAAIFAGATTWLFEAQKDEALRHKLQTIFASVASGFLSVGLAIMLHQDYLVFAIAGQILTVSYLSRRVDIPALRYIAQALAALLGCLMYRDVANMLLMPMDGFTKHLGKVYQPDAMLFRFGLPAVMLGASSWFIRKDKDDVFADMLEMAVLTLIVFLGFNGVANHYAGTGLDFMARGLFTNMLLLIGFGALLLNGANQRPGLLWGGIVVVGLAIVRCGYFDFLIYNPVWSHEMVGETPIINNLALVYGLPAVLLTISGWQISLAKQQEVAGFLKTLAVILTVSFALLTVRQFYHGEFLDRGGTTSAEVYAYSVALLGLGIAYLVAGVVREDRMMRMASLGIMLVTVAKAFLYDASELTGLWRVVSFLGLGVSLLGLNWFYSKFVFTSKSLPKRDAS